MFARAVTLLMLTAASSPLAADWYFSFLPGGPELKELEGFDVKRADPDEARFEYPAEREAFVIGIKRGENFGIDVAWETSVCAFLCTLDDTFSSLSTSFSADGLNLLVYYRVRGWDFGAGAVYYYGPYEKVRKEGRLKDKIEFAPTSGPIVKIEKRMGHFTLGARYEDLTFRADSPLELSNGEVRRNVDAERLVISWGFIF